MASILQTQTCHTLNLSQRHSASVSKLLRKGGELVAVSLVMALMSKEGPQQQ